MWKEVTETDLVPKEFYVTKREPMAHGDENEMLYLHPTLGWLTAGTYNQVLFPPTHYLDQKV